MVSAGRKMEGGGKGCHRREMKWGVDSTLVCVYSLGYWVVLKNVPIQSYMIRDIFYGPPDIKIDLENNLRSPGREGERDSQFKSLPYLAMSPQFASRGHCRNPSQPTVLSMWFILWSICLYVSPFVIFSFTLVMISREWCLQSVCKDLYSQLSRLRPLNLELKVSVTP